MISDYILFFYFWVTILSIWYYQKSIQETSKPEILFDKFIDNLFKLFRIVWVVTSVYVLFYTWLVLPIVLILWFVAKNRIQNHYYKVENVCLIPVNIIYGIRHRSEIASEIRADRKLNKDKDKNDFSLFDILFMLLFTISIAELFVPMDWITNQLQSEQIKPSWALASVLFLIAEPHKQLVYILTIIVGAIWVGLNVYKAWIKKGK